jgi:hypothetical protein
MAAAYAVQAMALLSSMIRSEAITGNTDASTFKWIAGRQGGRWAEQHITAAFPPKSPPPADAAEKLQSLNELHERGVVSDEEYERLRGRLGL